MKSLGTRLLSFLRQIDVFLIYVGKQSISWKPPQIVRGTLLHDGKTWSGGTEQPKGHQGLRKIRSLGFIGMKNKRKLLNHLGGLSLGPGRFCKQLPYGDDLVYASETQRNKGA